MEENPNQETKENKVEKQQVSPSDILEDPQKLQKIVDLINSHETEDTIVDFGPDFLPIELTTVFFYMSSELGLVDILFNDEEGSYIKTKEFLKLYSEDKAQAEKYKQDCIGTLSELDREAIKFYTDNYDLSKIIPGMPKVVSEISTFAHKTMSLDTGYIEGIQYENEVKTLEKFNALASGKTVIDLGAGSGRSAGIRLACKANCIAYVGVEKYKTEGLLKSAIFNISFFIRGDHKESGIITPPKMHIALTDILTFLQNMPDKTKDVVIVASGIDRNILGTTYGWSDKPASEKQREEVENNIKYRDAINKELTRVLGEGSHFFGYHSDIYPA